MKRLIATLTLSFSTVSTLAAPAAIAAESEQAHQTTGVVKEIDQENGRVTLAHDPVPSLDWPGMTMPFAVEDQAVFEKLEPGQAVEFDFVESEGGMFVITEITPR